MTKVESSHIDDVSRDGESVIVTYKDGTRWRWDDIPDHVYNELLKGGDEGSVGRYLHRTIRPNYRGVKL